MMTEELRQFLKKLHEQKVETEIKDIGIKKYYE